MEYCLACTSVAEFNNWTMVVGWCTANPGGLPSNDDDQTITNGHQAFIHWTNQGDSGDVLHRPQTQNIQRHPTSPLVSYLNDAFYRPSSPLKVFRPDDFLFTFWVVALACLWRAQQLLTREDFYWGPRMPQASCPLKFLSAQYTLPCSWRS